MATVFMKWLERRPEAYDRGIRILTLGRLNQLWDQLSSRFVRESDHVLELGCGTGGLTHKMARVARKVTAIDVAPEMLEIAIDRLVNTTYADRVEFIRMDATGIEAQFQEECFDLIVSSLMMSELSSEERDLVLRSCLKLLKPEGRLVILDEVQPKGTFKRIFYYLFRLPIALLTWLLTKTSTRPLKDIPELLMKEGFQLETMVSYLGGSLCLVSACPMSESAQVKEIVTVTPLQHRVTLKTLLMNLWALFFRIVPPYPKHKPGLYSVGRPDKEAPVFVTGNFALTVQRVVKVLDGKLDAWLLVVDSAGINVWCAAGGGFFTADKILSAMTINPLEEVVKHRDLILPQLAAVGVDGNRIREEAGWNVLWGPVDAQDLPAYVESDFRKSDRMRRVTFPWLKRLEMVSGTLGFYGLMLLIPIAIFWRQILIPTAIAMIAISIFYAIFLPWLPGRDGLAKAIPLTTLAILGVIIHYFFWDSVPAGELFNRVMGISALSIFIAGEFQGMSPLMRGEQANWIPEVIIAVFLGLLYWLLPMILGWR